MESQPERSSPAPGSTVLLVEDNPTDVFVIKEVIGQCCGNLRVTVAKDGQEALASLQELARNNACPALVILDLNLPRVAGIEVLNELRKGSGCTRTPVIVVTSSSAVADRNAAERLGADAYFQKPADLATYMELVQLVECILRGGGRP